MKITVVSTSVFKCPPDGYSGLEFLAWQQAEGLARKGHQVTLVAPEGSTCDHATLLPTGPAGQWDERRTFPIYRDHLLTQDVIVDHSWSKSSYLLKMKGTLKAPVLGVCHAPVNTMYQTLPPIEKPSFICISEDQAKHFEALHSREAKVAYNGVDPNFYKPMSVPRSDRFLFLARFSTIKGPDIAIQACKEVGAGLDLVGDTSITQEPQYLEQCKAMADGKQIRFVGPAKRGECVWWYSQAHALLHPNQRFREPFGLAPVEAMLCGCPVIGWKYGAMKETISEGMTGLLADSYTQFVTHVKTLMNVLKDDDRPRCREWAQQFSVTAMIDRYEHLCHYAVQTGGW